MKNIGIFVYCEVADGSMLNTLYLKQLRQRQVAAYIAVSCTVAAIRWYHTNIFHEFCRTMFLYRYI